MVKRYNLDRRRGWMAPGEYVPASDYDRLKEERDLLEACIIALDKTDPVCVGPCSCPYCKERRAYDAWKRGQK